MFLLFVLLLLSGFESEKKNGSVFVLGDILNDPLYLRQWHFFYSNTFGINAQGAWQLGMTGHGVSVGVVVPQVSSLNFDLSHYEHESSFVSPSQEGDREFAEEGTGMAAVIAAKAGNHFCSVGIAYQANLILRELEFYNAVDFCDAIPDALAFYQKVDVNFIGLSVPPILGIARYDRRLSAIVNLITRLGRSTLGGLIVAKAPSGNCNYDGFMNDYAVMIAKGVNRAGKQVDDVSCPAVLSTVSSDLLTTIDVSCTEKTLNGTSGASATMAGIAALILEANPNLKWHEVQEIFIEASQMIDVQDPGWQFNGASKPYHHQYGFGLVEAGDAVKHAIYWPVPTLRLYQSFESFTKSFFIQDHDLASFPIAVSNSPQQVQHIGVSVVIEHENPGDLEITLYSPMGTASYFAQPRGITGKTMSLETPIGSMQLHSINQALSGQLEYSCSMRFKRVIVRELQLPSSAQNCCAGHLCRLPPEEDVLLVLYPSMQCSAVEQANSLAQNNPDLKGIIVVSGNEIDERFEEALLPLFGVSALSNLVLNQRIDIDLAVAFHKETYGQFGPWTFKSVAHWGEPAEGIWTLVIHDSSCGDSGSASEISLEIGYAVPDIP